MHRKATWAGVLFVAIVGALAATVLPATGAPGDNTGLPSDPLAVQPIENPSGGSTFACPSGLRQFDINNPKTGTYSTTVSGVPVSFTLTVASGGNTVKDKYLSFRASNASVHKVAVKGGTKTALYEYSSPASADGYGTGTINPLQVDTDAGNGRIGLHGPVDSSGAPFSASYTTFCFTLPTESFSCSEEAPMTGTALGGIGGTVTYEAVLVAQGGVCKSGDAVMYSQPSAGNKFFATLHPVVPGGTNYQVVEHIVWTGITGNVQNPVLLLYDDVAPFDGLAPSPWRTMLQCGSDPRPDPIGDPWDLDGNTPAMPAGSPPHTTCMLQSTDIAGGIYDAWLYSNIDGSRGA